MKNAKAILTIKNVSLMTKLERKNISEWLKKEAKSIIKDGHNYSKKFTARIF